MLSGLASGSNTHTHETSRTAQQDRKQFSSEMCVGVRAAPAAAASNLIVCWKTQLRMSTYL